MTGSLRHERGFVRSGGAEIYREIRGRGPAVLFIQGAFGDGATFDPIATILADDFTTIVYDRRGNSRSPSPIGYSEMLLTEQADDAAAVIRDAGAVPCVVFATSGGALIGLELLIRHPGLLRGAILHEPALLSSLADTPYHDGPARLGAMARDASAAGVPERIAEAFIRGGSGDAAWEGLDAELRVRLQRNGHVFAKAEFERFASYVPDEGSLSEIDRPIVIMAGTTSAPFRRYICDWFGARMDCAIRELPGGHMAYLDDPVRSAEVLRPILHEMAPP